MHKYFYAELSGQMFVFWAEDDDSAWIHAEKEWHPGGELARVLSQSSKLVRRGPMREIPVPHNFE